MRDGLCNVNLYWKGVNMFRTLLMLSSSLLTCVMCCPPPSLPTVRANFIAWNRALNPDVSYLSIDNMSPPVGALSTIW